MSIKDEAVQVLINKASKLFGKDPSTMNADTRFVEDLGAKSTNFVQFSAALEDEFDVEVSYMELVKKKTFGEAGEYMEELLSE